MIEKEKIAYDLLLSFLNCPYKWGGSNPMDGFDCSGMVCFFLQSLGIIKNKYRTNSQGLYNKFSKDHVKRKVPDLGTLAFYGEGKTRIKHVAVMLNSELMIEAAGGDSSTIFLIDAKKLNACVRIRPYDFRKDFIEFITPTHFGV